MTSLKFYCNCDTTDSPLGTTGVDWVEMVLGTDYLVFTAGSVAVADGQPIPSAQELSQAGVVITNAIQVLPHYLLADIGVGLKEIHNAGAKNKRYVFCVSFDGATTSEPVLEVWDDSDFDTFADICLGASVATDSWYNGITTTIGLPSGGASWVGNKLAGSSSTHFLYLNDGNGALSGATDLYFQFRIAIPANVQVGGSESPCLVIKFTTN